MKLLLIIAVACLLSSSKASPINASITAALGLGGGGGGGGGSGSSGVSEDTKVESTQVVVEPTLPIVTSDTVASTAVPADTPTTVTSSDEGVRVKREDIPPICPSSLCQIGK